MTSIWPMRKQDQGLGRLRTSQLVRARAGIRTQSSGPHSGPFPFPGVSSAAAGLADATSASQLDSGWLVPSVQVQILPLREHLNDNLRDTWKQIRKNQNNTLSCPVAGFFGSYLECGASVSRVCVHWHDLGQTTHLLDSIPHG